MLVVNRSCLIGTIGLLSTTFFSSGRSLFSKDMMLERFCNGAGVERLVDIDTMELGRGNSVCACCLGDCSKPRALLMTAAILFIPEEGSCLYCCIPDIGSCLYCCIPEEDSCLYCCIADKGSCLNCCTG